MISLITAIVGIILSLSSQLVSSFQLPPLCHVQRRVLESPAFNRLSPSLHTTTSQSNEKGFRTGTVVIGPPSETKPDYENIHGPLGKFMDDVFMKLFRSKLAEHAEFDSSLAQNDFNGIMEVTNAMNARFSDRTEVHKRAQAVLRAMFPGWMPSSYAVLFSKPFPEFSSRMNAWATWVAGTWLMGECEVNDVKVDGDKIGKNQGLLVKRCRFLEESGCASVCVNSCKIPTQNFFMQDMGLPLTMTPDYETFECQFSFGLTPTQASEAEAKSTPCLARCPSLGGMRKWHQGETSAMPAAATQQCDLMESS